MKVHLREGGEGSGNFRHKGRKGQVGGSSKDDYQDLEYSDFPKKKFKAKEIEAFSMWTGMWFPCFGDYLRYDKISGGLYNQEELDEAIGIIDNSINQTFKENIYLYRGVHSKWNLKVGDTFTDKNFVATSASKHWANLFTDSEEATIFRIHVKAGTKFTVTPHSGEQEIILARNTKFRVIGFSKIPLYAKEYFPKVETISVVDVEIYE